MNTLGNIIWLVFGGFLIFLQYLIGGLLLCLTIVGIPFGIQIIKMASLALWPFNKKIVYKEDQPGCLSTFMNILWLLLGGIWIAISHLVFGVLLFLLIVSIPWAKQHFKMVSLAISPFGKEIVDK